MSEGTHAWGTLNEQIQEAPKIVGHGALQPDIGDRCGLEPGTRVGHYVIERLIAVGGSAVVYQARDPRACRDVAIKLLHPGTELDRERARRLFHEARAYTRLVHPRIVTLFEVGEHEGSPFLVMEWVNGTTLADRLAAGAMDAHECLRVMEQVADGLSAAHALGLAHRDIKPANIMLTPDGNAKLLDSGLAKQVSPGEMLPKSWVTSDGAILGTPAYMSPEQVQGRELTLAADVFASGAVLYEALCGTPAFWRESTLETLNAVSQGWTKPLPRLRSRVGRGLARLAKSCLAIVPDGRTMAFVIPSTVDDARLRIVNLADDLGGMELLWEEPIVVNRWAGGKPGGSGGVERVRERAFRQSWVERGRFGGRSGDAVEGQDRTGGSYGDLGRTG